MLKIIQLYLSGDYSFEKLGQKFQIHKSTLKEWYVKYEVFGEAVF
ncbi:helix-turn-helix domain-containing protein, partial [Lysinibacillus telephonicus]